MKIEVNNPAAFDRIEDPEVIVSGITRLKNVLSELCQDKMPVKQREQALSTIDQLLTKFKSFLFDGAYNEILTLSDLTHYLYEDVLKEANTNHTKSGQKSFSPKYDSITIFVKLASELADSSRRVFVQENDIQLSAMLLKLLSNEFINKQSWMEASLASILSKFISHANLPEFDTKLLKQLWQRTIRLLKQKTGSSAMYYTRIALHILQSARKTVLYLSGKELVMDLFAAITDAGNAPKSASKAYMQCLLELYTFCIEVWGIQCRDRILSTTVAYAEFLSESLTMETNDENDVCWRFLDRFFQLAMPDCNPSALTFEPVYSVASQVLRSSVKNFLSMSVNRVGFLVPDDKLYLIGRVLVICELCPDGDRICLDQSLASRTVLTQSTPAKRRKDVSIFESLINWDFEYSGRPLDPFQRPNIICSCLLILNSVVRCWSHRLGRIRKEQIASDIWKQNSKISDTQRGYYCDLLCTLVDEDVFGTNTVHVKSELTLMSDIMQDPRVRIKAIWKYAVASSHIDDAFNASVKLIISLLKRFKEIIGSDTAIVDTLMSVSSQSCSSNSLDSLMFMLGYLDFDERITFPGIDEKSSGIAQWRLRCQLADWFIQNSLEDISHFLYQLCLYHPVDMGKNECEKKKLNTLDHDLKSLGLISKQRFPVPSKSDEPNLWEPFVDLLISEVVEYILLRLNDIWCQRTRNTERVFLCNVILRFCRKLLSNAKRAPSLNPIHSLLISCSEWITATCSLAPEERSGLLEGLDPSPAGYGNEITVAAREALMDRSIECPVLFARFGTRGFQIPPQCFLVYMDEIVRLLRCGTANPTLREEARSQLERFLTALDFLPDALLLIEKCGDVMEEPIRSAMIQRARQIAEEDGESGEQDDEIKQLSALMINELEVQMKSDTEDNLLPPDTVNGIPSAIAVTNLDIIILNSTVFSSLYNSSQTDYILLQCLIRHTLTSSPHLWPIFPQLIAQIVGDRKLYDICMDFIPNFDKYVEFYSISLAINKVKCQPNEVQRCLLSFQDCPIAKTVAQKERFSAVDFPDVFRLDINTDIMSAVTESFWKLYSDNSCHLLASLLSLSSSNMILGLQHRLLSILDELAASAPKMAHKMKKPFVVIVRTIMMHIFSSLIDRKKYGQTEELFEYCNVIGLSLEDNFMCMAYLIDIWSPSVDSDVTNMAKEKLQEIVKREAICLVKNGSTEVIDVFMLSSFWDYLLTKLSQRPEFIKEMRKRENFMFDKFLLAWELIPHIRPVLTKLMLLFDKECESKPMFRAKKASKSYLSCLADYCQLQLACYRNVPGYDVSLCCLHVLSADCFEDQSILSSTQAIPSTHDSVIPNTDVSVELCDTLLKVVTDHVRDNLANQPLFVLRGRLKEMPILCHLLAPYLCATEAAIECAKAVLEFGIEHFSHIEPSDTSVHRIARTVCECVDGIGLDNLSSINCSPTELFVIARLVETAGYLQHAYAVVNLAFDRLVVNSRNRIGYGGRVPDNNRQLTELLQDIYVHSNDYNASKSLPGWAQVSPRVQHLKALSNNNWLRLSSDSLSTPEQVTMARFYCGSISDPVDQDSGYLTAIVALDWLQMNVSYSKKLSGKWSRMYAVIFHVVDTKDTEIFSALRLTLMKKVASLDVTDLATHGSTLIAEVKEIEFLENFVLGYLTHEIMENSKPLSLLMALSYCYLEYSTSTQSSVFSPDISSVTDSQFAEIADATSSIIRICNRKLMSIKAFPACLKILAIWQTVVQGNSSTYKRFSDILQIEKCRIMISTGDYQMAHYHLTNLAGQNVNYDLAAEAICLMSRIRVDDMQQLDGAITLMSDLLDTLLDQIPKQVATKAIKQQHELAQQQLAELESYMRTPSYTTRVQAVNHWQEQKLREKIRKGASDMSSDEKRQLTIVSRELECEQREIKKVNEHLEATVGLIVKSGFMLLKYLGPVDTSSPPSELEKSNCIRIIFPLLDIIFRYESQPSVIDQFRKYILDVTPSIWVPVLSHIVSHCFTDSPLAFVIRDLVSRLIVAYPHHVLPTLLGYKFDGIQLHKKLAHYKTRADNFRHRKSEMDPGALSFEDSEFLIPSTVGPRIDSLIAVAERRVIQSERIQFKNIVIGMTAAHHMYRQFVWLRTDAVQYFTKTREGYAMSRENILIVKNISLLKDIPLPVIDQTMGRAGCYEETDLIKWDDIDLICQKADGQSAPKVIRVKGSDGIWYKSVWKYGEDLRQDSFVQQFFVVMSDLLRTRQPLRTYHVLPLDGYSGVIKFCENTSALKNILVGSEMKTGLHNEVYPREDVNGVRTDVTNLQRSGEMTNEVFQREVLDKITPVFRKFFYKKFPTVTDWSRMVENYVLSLAEWSIVCYIVGLGDRHTSNVLFDEETCNFVHIDLGMIMEYGTRILPIPERVPFRLTRDLIDPFLIQGINGTLNSSCSNALSNLRKNKQIILGMGSIFLRETMANFRDSSDVAKPSFVSATAISRLRDKLNGTDATIASVSSNIQAQRLLAEATNIENLSALFSGWASFL